jgi:Zn-dependent peptidase ImmA (M78 family)
VRILSYIYSPFELENFVSILYIKLGIFYPNEINEQHIASRLEIELVYSRFRSYADESDGFKIINVHKYLDAIQKREVFFHELGHLLLHGGDQRYVPKMFRDWQEWAANRFTRYAAIPYHMLKFIDFSRSRTHILLQMQEMFKVSEKLCLERLEQIERNTRKNHAYIQMR